MFRRVYTVVSDNILSFTEDSVTRGDEVSLQRSADSTPVLTHGNDRRIKYALKKMPEVMYFGLHAFLAPPEHILILFSVEEWFHPSEYANSQNNRYWSTENPHLLYEKPFHGVKIGVWCALSSTRILGPIFFQHHRYR